MGILEVIYSTLVDVEHIKISSTIQLQCTGSHLIEVTVFAGTLLDTAIQNQRTCIIDGTAILAKHDRMRSCHTCSNLQDTVVAQGDGIVCGSQRTIFQTILIGKSCWYQGTALNVGTTTILVGILDIDSTSALYVQRTFAQDRAFTCKAINLLVILEVEISRSHILSNAHIACSSIVIEGQFITRNEHLVRRTEVLC